MHTLDFIMYLLLSGGIYRFMDWVSDGDWTRDIGAMAWILFQCIFTIVYLVVFVWIDLNWIDLFRWLMAQQASGWFQW